jgi:hypothetical protein
MMRGRDAYICSSCIEDAAGIMDGDVRDCDDGRSRVDDEPEPVDFQAAYLYLRSAPAPIVDLLRQTCRQELDFYRLACRIRQCRKYTDLDYLEEFAQRAASRDVCFSLRSQNAHQ